MAEPETHRLVRDLKAPFETAANADIAAGQAAYMKNRFRFLGLTKPVRAALQKPIFKSCPVEDEATLAGLLETLWAFDCREYHYAALDLAVACQKIHTPALLPVLTRMTKANQWWDSIDPLAANLIGRLALRYPALNGEIASWIHQDDFWLRRVAILFQLKHKAKTDAALLFSLCEQTLHEKEFFIRKAIGWALREYAKTNPHAVWKFTQAHRPQMSGLSYREATRRIAADFE